MYGGVTSSGRKLADAQITALPGILHNIVVEAPTAGVATLIIYDSENSTISGKKEIARVVIDTASTVDEVVHLNPVVANRGIYAVYTGDSGFNVHYSIM